MIRALKHLLIPDWLALRVFSKDAFARIEAAIQASEKSHSGELRFVVEAGLPLAFLGVATRKRAEALFAQLGVWDTEQNSGVLVYVELVDRRIEIVADRGIAAKVEQAEWSAICRAMEIAYGKGDYVEGSLHAIDAITGILARHFPPGRRNPNELADKPVVL